MIHAGAWITNTKACTMSTRSITGVARPVLTLPGLLRHIAAMRATRRQRLCLARLDTTALADIGITREQACAEARRPVWDVTPSWRS